MSTPEAVATPTTPAVAPDGAIPTGEAAPQVAVETGPSPMDAKVISARVKAALTQRERHNAVENKAKALEAKEKELAGLAGLAEMAKTSPSKALRQLLGVKEGDFTPEMTAFLKQVSQEAVGVESEATALEALPKSVREKLDKLAALEEQAGEVPKLRERLDAILKEREEAMAALTARQQEEHARTLFTAGMERVTAEAETLDLVLAHPQSEDLIGEAWSGLLKAHTEKNKKPPTEAESAALVAEAARKVQAELEQANGWLLKSKRFAGKMDSTVGASPQEAPAKSPGQGTGRKPARTGTPGMGEPGAVDFAKLTLSQRVKALSDMERAEFKRPAK